MPPRSFYRLVVWLPLIVPSGMLALHRSWHSVLWESPVGVFGYQILMFSLLYGGVPYACLAIWATIYIGRESEDKVKRLMFAAPLIMASVYLPFAAAIGLGLAAATHSLRPLRQFIALGIIGATVSIVLGYFYVGCVLLIRKLLQGSARRW